MGWLYENWLPLSKDSCDTTGNVSVNTMKYMIQYIWVLDTYYQSQNAMSKRQVTMINKNLTSQIEDVMNQRYEELLSANVYTWRRSQEAVLETDPLWQQMVWFYRAISFYQNDKADIMGAYYTLDDSSSDSYIQDLSEEQKASINSWFIRWNTGVNTLLIEFADIGCWACIYQYNSNVLSDVLTQLSWYVKYMYAPIDIGYWAEYQAKAILCADTLSWTDAAKMMRTYIYDNSYPIIGTHNVMLANSNDIGIYAQLQLGIPKTDLESCIMSWDTTTLYDNIYTIGSYLYNLSSTPTTIIINHDTQKRSSIWGWYGTSAFMEIIDALSFTGSSE